MDMDTVTTAPGAETPPPAYAQAVADLASWSENYDFPTPFTLFCDLIGFNADEYGECYFLPQYRGPYLSARRDRFEVDANTIHNVQSIHADLIASKLGYVELSKLAAALAEYAERPGDVLAYVRQIMLGDEGDS